MTVQEVTTVRVDAVAFDRPANLVHEFVGLSGGNYASTFEAAERGTLSVTHLNRAALFAGPFWGAARGVWALFWGCLATDVIALMLVASSWTSDGGNVLRGLATAASMFVFGRLANGWLADRLYYQRYTTWRADRTMLHGCSHQRLSIGALLALLTVPAMLYRATQVAPSARDCCRLWDALAGSADMTTCRRQIAF